MIAVIADDFTGAAELGGIGLRYNLSVEISTAVIPATQADLLVIAADTRSGDEADAVIKMQELTRELLQLKPSLVFKKTDSVLRGHIMAEMKAQLAILQIPRALLIAANPALGRTIHDGTYFLHGQPIHLSSFSEDPEFPVTRSDIPGMLRVVRQAVHIKKTTEALPETGIIVGEVQNTADTNAWAAQVDDNTLAAGGAGFFTALLDKLAIKKAGTTNTAAAAPGLPALFVSGTTFHKSRAAIKRIYDAGGPVSYMPDAIATAASDIPFLYEAWCRELVSMLRAQGQAFIAIRGEDSGKALAHAAILRKRMALLVYMVLQQVSIAELFIEGGSTAYAVLQKAGLTGFFPVEEMAPGVVRMSVREKPGLYITVKPGSYDWPANNHIAI